jgi:tRNA(Ile)-lysidine synthase TilS/MesJ
MPHIRSKLTEIDISNYFKKKRDSHCKHGHRYSFKTSLYEAFQGATQRFVVRSCRICRSARDNAAYAKAKKHKANESQS